MHSSSDKDQVHVTVDEFVMEESSLMQLKELPLRDSVWLLRVTAQCTEEENVLEILSEFRKIEAHPGEIIGLVLILILSSYVPCRY